jgi:hypothetical protein
VPPGPVPPAPAPPTRQSGEPPTGGEVAGTAKEKAREVAGEAGRQARDVTAEAGERARDLVYEARGQLRSQASTQRDRAAANVRSFSDELAKMATSGQSGPATTLVREAADRARAFATYLEEREPGDLLEEVREFARRRPGVFLLGAAIAGVLAGRLTRSVTAATTETGRRLPTQRAVGSETGHPAYRDSSYPPDQPDQLSETAPGTAAAHGTSGRATEEGNWPTPPPPSRPEGSTW